MARSQETWVHTSLSSHLWKEKVEVRQAQGSFWVSPQHLLSFSNCRGIDSTPRALRSSPYSNFYSCCKVKNKRGWNLYGSFEFWHVMTKSYKAWARGNDWEKFSEGWFQEKPFVFLWFFSMTILWKIQGLSLTETHTCQWSDCLHMNSLNKP